MFKSLGEESQQRRQEDVAIEVGRERGEVGLLETKWKEVFQGGGTA